MGGGRCTPFLFDALVDRKDEIETVLVRDEGGAAVKKANESPRPSVVEVTVDHLPHFKRMSQ